MAIDSKFPQVSLLKEKVEQAFGKRLHVHSDFENLRDSIFAATKEHISETTLERLWGYSTRGYDSVSRRTLDVLSVFTGVADWEAFLKQLKEEAKSESDMFDFEFIDVSTLQPGVRLRIGWLPDRVCIIRYLGDGRFIAEETRNSKLCPGDTFSCLQLQLHRPLYVSDLKDEAGQLKGVSYGIGLQHGLTTLQRLTILPDKGPSHTSAV